MSKFISNIKKSVKTYIVRGRVGMAIDVLVREMDRFSKETTNDIILIAHRYEVNERKNRCGIISNADYDIQLDHIVKAVLNQLEVIESEIKKIFFRLFIST